METNIQYPPPFPTYLPIRMKFFEQRLTECRRALMASGIPNDMIALETAIEGVNRGLSGSQKFSRPEVLTCLQILNDDNRVSVEVGGVYIETPAHHPSASFFL